MVTIIRKEVLLNFAKIVKLHPLQKNTNHLKLKKLVCKDLSCTVAAAKKQDIIINVLNINILKNYN